MAGTSDKSSSTSSTGDESTRTSATDTGSGDYPPGSSRENKPPRIRERRATAQVTPEQLFNERQGLEQAVAYAETSGDSEAMSAARSALSDHERREADLENEDLVVVGTANIDQNSAKTPRPESELVTDEEAAYPRGAAQAPDLVYVPDPAAHTDAVQRANAEKAAQERADNEKAARSSSSGGSSSSATGSGSAGGATTSKA